MSTAKKRPAPDSKARANSETPSKPSRATPRFDRLSLDSKKPRANSACPTIPTATTPSGVSKRAPKKRRSTLATPRENTIQEEQDHKPAVVPVAPSSAQKPKPSRKRRHSTAIIRNADYQDPDSDPALLLRKSKKRRTRLSLPARLYSPGASSSVAATADEEDEEAKAAAEDFAMLRSEGFTLQEATLFQKIRRRGREPLFPAHWRVDFATSPVNLFTTGPCCIKSLAGQEGTFAATTHFQMLVNLGSVARGMMENGLECEAKVLAGIRRFISWSVDDAKLENLPIYPQIAISSSRDKGAEYCEQRMTQKMRDLAACRRLEESRLSAADVTIDPDSPGTIYGFAVSGPVVALVTLNARDENAPTRTLLVMDLSDFLLDFWNAVGIALLVIAARDDEVKCLNFYSLNDQKRKFGNDTTAWQLKFKTEVKLEDDEDA